MTEPVQISEVRALALRKELEQQQAQPKEQEDRSLAAQAIPLSIKSLRNEPPPPRFLLTDAATGNGVFVAADVGLLAATGGSGKTWALCQLAVAVATGTTWFGPGGWAPTEPGRVLLILAEQTKLSVERRLHFACRAAGLLSDEHLLQVARNVTAMALRGHRVSLVDRKGDPTSFSTALTEMLTDAVREERPYSLLVLDPLARFAAGTDTEKDNDLATQFVQILERLTWRDCGEPSVLAAHHTRKVGKDDHADSADPIRGARALVDGVRWAARLEQQERKEGAPDLLTLRLVKANDVPPMMGPVILCRSGDYAGTLRLASPGEQEAHEGVAKMTRTRLQTIEDHAARVLEAMKPDLVYSRNELAKACGGKKTAVLTAVASLLASGHLEAVGRGPRDPHAGVRLATPPTPTTGDLFTPPENAGTSTGTSSGKAAERTGSPGGFPAVRPDPREPVAAGGPGTNPGGSEGTSTGEPVGREPVAEARQSP